MSENIDNDGITQLKDEPGKPQLGWNLHVMGGHQRLAFVKRHVKGPSVLDIAAAKVASLWL